MTPSETPRSRSEFTQAWCGGFGNTPPLGHMLRHSFHGDRTRFRTLPGSWRYAETEAERETVRARAQALAKACFDVDDSLWLVAARYSETELDGDDVVSRMKLSRVFVWADEGEQDKVTFFGARIFGRSRRWTRC